MQARAGSRLFDPRLKRFHLAMVFAFSAATVQAAELEPMVFPVHMPDGRTDFTMPSGNVECLYTPAHFRGVYRTPDDLAELSCDRAEPTYLNITLGEAIMPSIVKSPTEQPCCGVLNTFSYGRSWHEGPFTCESRIDGLSCMRADGHGFRLSRRVAKVF